MSSSLCVTILSSDDACLAHGESADALAVTAVHDEVDAIERACRDNGFETACVTASADLERTIAALAATKPDIVFHLAESVRGEARLEAAVAWMLEWLGLPHTGSGPLALTLALNKPLARAALSAAGVPVPRGFVIERADAPLDPAVRELANARWIVKPSREDASHGIALESVVRGERALRERAAYVIETYAQPALVEEFVEGRELNVSILGSGTRASVLPISEIDFTSFPSGAPKLVTFAAKWIESSPDYRGTPPVPAQLDAELERTVRSTALAAYNALGLAGYGRIDMRVDAERGPLVIDVNPNPDISPTAGFARAAERAGLSYAQLIARILEEARRDDRLPATAASR
jgi:D-alanine-D-alanine ligase